MPSRSRGFVVVLIAAIAAAGLGLFGAGARTNRPVAAGGAGEVADVALQSRALLGRLRFRVYLPAGYR
jgi:hypothetical protein